MNVFERLLKLYKKGGLKRLQNQVHVHFSFQRNKKNQYNVVEAQVEGDVEAKA